MTIVAAAAVVVCLAVLGAVWAGHRSRAASERSRVAAAEAERRRFEAT